MRKRYILTAVIYDKRGRILSVGKNSYVKTHTLMARAAAEVGLPDKQFIHAEFDAIMKCRDISKAHRIFVTRTDEKGTYGNAQPCPVCESLIRKAGIKIVEHT